MNNIIKKQKRKKTDLSDNGFISVFGAKQNNLNNLTLDIPLGKITVVTGVSGSGKSSLVFDTITAEGQRRYIETFSSYARQFIDRMDRPKVNRILGVPPAVAIEQKNPIKNSRSTVGTMTEISDHLKLLFARFSKLHCKDCKREIIEMPARKVAEDIIKINSGKKIAVAFSLHVPKSISDEDLVNSLSVQGYTRLYNRTNKKATVIVDKFVINKSIDESRLVESIEDAYKTSNNFCEIIDLTEKKRISIYSKNFSCPYCEIKYKRPRPALFSFNSPIGACENCKGFGRIIGVNLKLIIPDENKTLLDGAIKPFQSKSYSNCQKELIEYAIKENIPVNIPWNKLSLKSRKWVVDGSFDWKGKWTREWYGINRFFKKLEKKSYKMHVRVLLSRYRSYTKCPCCNGSRLKEESLNWTISNKNIYEWQSQPISEIDNGIEKLRIESSINSKSKNKEAIDILIEELKTRLSFCKKVGLGYLTLDRQSRTLSGGEVQRINLTTALGTSLVNTMFVLDEPSIGLHSRDVENLVKVILQLRDAGNTILIVEHDPQVIAASDHIIELGPGPGNKGGNICFQGSFNELLQSNSLTGEYLNNQRKINIKKTNLKCISKNNFIYLHEASANNIKKINIKIPLDCICCITGVSGSGKSTLIQDILYPAISEKLNLSNNYKKNYKKIEGFQKFSQVINVDQSPIGKTSRSNPVLYVGAFDEIRKIFSNTEEARNRIYTTSNFSFNTGNGRCPECLGNGYERIEMQFLSDVFLSCSQCNGSRYRKEILEITFNKKTIADVLNMTVYEACIFFENEKKIINQLSSLLSVGLGYLKLGQSLPTLSGGESQRLKIAGHLSNFKSSKNINSKNKNPDSTLFLFDEPTTGLHLDDIKVLFNALTRLVKEGHSVIVIEHSLEFIACCDWIIDLGPEAGVKGGRIIAEGTPTKIIESKFSHTGRSLAKYSIQENKKYANEYLSKLIPKKISKFIEIINARENNLKNLCVKIPHNKLTVITGVSGSGKSSLAFDILFAEGQRRYLESLNAYARQFVQPGARPDLDSINGIAPTVAIEQRTSQGGNKSTVGTLTEVHHFLRLLFVRNGKQFCPECNVAISPLSKESILSVIISKFQGTKVNVLSPLIIRRKGSYKDLATWAVKRNYSKLRVDGKIYLSKNFPNLDRYKEHNIELVLKELVVDKKNENELFEIIEEALILGKGVIGIQGKKIKSTDKKSSEKDTHFNAMLFSTQNACPQCNTGFNDLDPRLFSFNSKLGMCPLCFGSGFNTPECTEKFDVNQEDENHLPYLSNGDLEICQECKGGRLNKVAQSVLILNKSINNLSELSIFDLQKWLNSYSKTLSSRDRLVVKDLILEILNRLNFLEEVGLGYLTLNRAAPTLSGGESQRIRLASQLGSNLKGVCYILDEPTIGLHPKDNKSLLRILRALQTKGNTIVIVEHDEETINLADHIIDIGPLAGIKGGRLIAEGKLNDIITNNQSITGKYLANSIQYEKTFKKVSKNSYICVQGAYVNNLKNIDVKIPLHPLLLA
tara:strand:- start:327 stop:4904 length:4578 start_codon:yes stop_codon:yes gene_type:complete